MNRGNKDKLSIGNRFFSALNNRGLLLWVPDKYVLKKLFKIKTGKKLDLKNPKTYGEKVQWLKLYNRKPEYVMMVDKLKVKEYVAQTIGKQYVIPVITVWESVDEINWDTLPNQFVLKCNHDQGGIVICRNKKELNKNKAKQILHQHMKRSGYWYGREWPYKDVDRKIFAEIYREDCTGELLDYKVLCFNGIPKLIEIHRGRFGDHTQDFFDTNWNRTDIYQDGLPHSKIPMEKPHFLDEMLQLSELLSKNIPHVRVDWYHDGKQLLFGELTFYDGSGFDLFKPTEWDYKLGEWINLCGADCSDL